MLCLLKIMVYLLVFESDEHLNNYLFKNDSQPGVQRTFYGGSFCAHVGVPGLPGVRKEGAPRLPTAELIRGDQGVLP